MAGRESVEPLDEVTAASPLDNHIMSCSLFVNRSWRLARRSVFMGFWVTLGTERHFIHAFEMLSFVSSVV